MSDNRIMLRLRGFTLAELLIALAILGVIATFTIPKVLMAQQDQKFNSIAKEAIASFSGAYQAYKVNNTVSGSTTVGLLTPYLNYVAVDTATAIDRVQTQSTMTCGDTNRICLVLHNGARMFLGPNVSFAGTATTNAIWFTLDPDGRVTDGTTNGPGKSITFIMYYNGRVVTYDTLEPNTVNSETTVANPVPAYVPSWFSWD